MLRSKLVYTAAGFLAGVAMTAATVAGSARPVGADEAENAMMLAQKAQVMAVTYQLDKTGLHDIDVSAHEGKIVSGALGNVRRGRIAAEATTWPEALKPLAMETIESMKALEEAIRTEDAARVAVPAKAAHDKEHDLSAAVYTWLSTGAAPAAGHGHGH
jgi:hypothetical protein